MGVSAGESCCAEASDRRCCSHANGPPPPRWCAAESLCSAFAADCVPGCSSSPEAADTAAAAPAAWIASADVPDSAWPGLLLLLCGDLMELARATAASRRPAPALATPTRPTVPAVSPPTPAWGSGSVQIGQAVKVGDRQGQLLSAIQPVCILSGLPTGCNMRQHRPPAGQ